MFTIIAIILVTVWAVNNLVTVLFVLEPLFDKYDSDECIDFRKNHESFEIGEYHSPTRVSAWFGFKHWFYPYDYEG